MLHRNDRGNGKWRGRRRFERLSESCGVLESLDSRFDNPLSRWPGSPRDPSERSHCLSGSSPFPVVHVSFPFCPISTGVEWASAPFDSRGARSQGVCLDIPKAGSFLSRPPSLPTPWGFSGGRCRVATPRLSSSRSPDVGLSQRTVDLIHQRRRPKNLRPRLKPPNLHLCDRSPAALRRSNTSSFRRLDDS